MLKRLHVDNYRCLTNFELTPDRIAVLVGPNGSGKSTVFEALRAVQGFLITGGTVFDAFSPTTLTRWDARREQRFELDVVDANGSQHAYALEVRHDAHSREAVIVDETLRADGDLLYRLADGEVQLFGDDANKEPRAAFPFGSKRSFLPQLEPRADNRRISAFKQWLSGMWLFSLRPHTIDPTSTQESDGIHPTGANFVSWYRTLVQASPEISEKVRSDIAAIVPGLSSIRLLKLSPETRFMNLDCVLSDRKFGLSLDELSEGQRTLLVLYTVLHALAPWTSLLVFDEPDNFVAQSEIQPWLSGLRDAVVDAAKGTLLVISHHPEVIDYLAADQALLFRRDSGGPTRMHELQIDRAQGVTVSEWLRLGAGDGE